MLLFTGLLRRRRAAERALVAGANARMTESAARVAAMLKSARGGAAGYDDEAEDIVTLGRRSGAL